MNNGFYIEGYPIFITNKLKANGGKITLRLGRVSELIATVRTCYQC